MATFKDKDDREWILDVNYDTVKMIRSVEDGDPDFMLEQHDKPNTWFRLESDPVLMCRVIYLLCQKQCESQEISEKDFYLRTLRDSIDSAGNALLQEMLSFYPPRPRQVLAAIVAKQSAIQERTLELLASEKTDSLIMGAIEKQMEDVLTTPLSNAKEMPEQSESDQTE